MPQVQHTALPSSAEDIILHVSGLFCVFALLPVIHQHCLPLSSGWQCLLEGKIRECCVCILYLYPMSFHTTALFVLQPSQIRWASRWDTYLLMTDDQIHWFSIINSLMIVLFLSGMVAMIMMRTLHRDISNYNQLETVEEAQEETGWKLVGFCG